MTNSKIHTVPFDAAIYLTTIESQSELLNDALETGDPTYIAVALGTIARARGMAEVAEGAGITREGLYKALSPTGDPRLSTLMGVMKALNLQFRAVPAERDHVTTG
ncbi:addiction module antidote protein [Lichenihabitans psoromatis]|uniref:addiction module antidote protein n=1 Tax=Lichenihabitans psoromatis TaxID=2528642 RepID=UPI0010383147|nr:addiction module antidote protein [Lichenihabitans psoromatis]